MVKIVPAGTALILILISGIVQGVWTGRWQHRELPHVWAARVCDVPLTLGDWDGEPLTLDAHSVEVAQIDGYFHRRYVHRQSKQEVVVSLVCGRPGPIGAHTPEICFGGGGYEVAQPPARFEVPEDQAGGPSVFWTARFHRPDDRTAPQFRVLWGWTTTGAWRAVSYPRVEFARAPALYKLYVSRTLRRPDEPLDRDPAVSFLRLLLPELRQALFPQSRAG
jgi:hypothetical protein